MLFEGYNSCPPNAIVLMGSFIKSSENPFTLKTKLAQLADVIEPYECIKQETDIVFVPSLDDPSTANILPRPPLPNCLWKDFQKKVPRAIFATNPCRLQYCTQQITVCRADLVTKFCRNTIHFPKSGQLEDHVRFFPFRFLTFPSFSSSVDKKKKNTFSVCSDAHLPRDTNTSMSSHASNVLAIRCCAQSLSTTRFDCYRRSKPRFPYHSARVHGDKHGKFVNKINTCCRLTNCIHCRGLFQSRNSLLKCTSLQAEPLKTLKFQATQTNEIFNKMLYCTVHRGDH